MAAPPRDPRALDPKLLADAIALVSWPEVRDHVAAAGLAFACDDVVWHDLARGAAYADCGSVAVTVGAVATVVSVHLNRDPQGAVTATHFALGADAPVATWLPAVHAALAAAADEATDRQGTMEYRFGAGRRALVLTPAGDDPVVQIGRSSGVR